MRVLVCGGRGYTNQERLFHILDQIHGEDQCIRLIIEGEAPGADQLAALWAARREIKLLPFPADWNRYGLSAGPRRNRQMLIEGRPDFVVAFPGGTGTADMVKQAERAGYKVRKVQ